MALEPRDPGRVGIYACGPTVYNRIHIGNARPYVVYSLLDRFLEHEGYDVTLVANVTDVNDKIYDAASGRGVPSADLAREMTAAYVADTDGLGLGRPDHEPLAGETIGPIVELIEALIENGSAYAAEGDVYFRVRRDARYGELSHRELDAMDQGEDVEGAHLKEDPLDFALWKATKEGEDTSWDAPWGRGRPGWHIECSAMAEQLLGVGLDIHGGGNDLIFPHHENEAAQTRMARGAELASIWMHNGMLQMGEEKMAKSVGNIALLGEVLERWGRDARDPVLRRRPLPPAAALRRRVDGPGAGRRQAPARGGPAARQRRPRRRTWRDHRERFFEALADDFNTPRALAEVWALGRRGQQARGRRRRRPARDARACSALDNLLDAGARRRARRRGARAARARASRRAPTRTGRPPTRSATSSRRSAGRSATAPAARRWCGRERGRARPRSP